MNRPFSAFGALAAMLGLAMFAVSSTSRSTTAGHARLARGRAPAATTRVDRAPAPCGFQEGLNRWSCQATPSICVQTNARQVNEPPLAARSALQPACIGEVEWTTALPRAIALNDLAASRMDRTVAGSAGSESLDVATLFNDVLKRRPEPNRQGARPARDRHDRAELYDRGLKAWRQLVFVVSGAKAHVVGQWHSLLGTLYFKESGAAQTQVSLSWPEYAQLMGAADIADRTSSRRQTHTEESHPVRSSGDLLHSAASAMNHGAVRQVHAADETPTSDEDQAADSATACD